jgi:hypothetical protein
LIHTPKVAQIRVWYDEDVSPKPRYEEKNWFERSLLPKITRSLLSANINLHVTSIYSMKTNDVHRSKNVEEIVSYRAPDLLIEMKSPDKKQYEVIIAVERTTHSPDGSNIEKRYPLTYICRKKNVSSLTVVPLYKQRIQGQTNRIPSRFADFFFQESMNFLKTPDRSRWPALLIPYKNYTPNKDLIIGGRVLNIDTLTFSDDWISEFISNRIVLQIDPGEKTARSRITKQLLKIQNVMQTIVKAGKIVKARTVNEDDGLIVVANLLPETGWWDRGTGQFDSIDGRFFFPFG